MLSCQSQSSPVLNSFDTESARRNSSYAAYQDDKLVHPQSPEVKPSALLSFVHDSFRALY